MKKETERTVEEIVEELKFITHPDSDGIMGSCGFPCHQCEKDKKVKGWLTQTLQAERQRCEEMVEVEREKWEIAVATNTLHQITNKLKALTQPNNPE